MGCLSCFRYGVCVLVAYLDEFGHVGPYMSTTHRKFCHHPVFGYAGIVIPAENVRAFGAKFERVKERQFRSEIVASGDHPRRWEKKGSEIFTTGAFERYPQRVDFIADLADYLTKLGGRLFFYGEVKPIGTEKMTGESASARTTQVLTEVVRRLCRYADGLDKHLTVLLDQGGPMPREEAITSMASFIYSSDHPSMKRIIEVPMQLESHRYGAMQFADWICAIATRASHFHLSDSDEFSWAPPAFRQIVGRRATPDSRIWLSSRHIGISAGALAHGRKWLGSSFQRRESDHGTHLTHTVADALLQAPDRASA